MQVVVRTKLLVPGMQDQREPNLALELTPTEFQQCLGCRVEQQLKQQPLIGFAGEDQRVEFVRKRKDIVEVGYRQQLKLTRRPPGFFGRRLALGAVAVAAAVVVVSLKTTPRATLAMAAEDCGSAVHDLLHHLAMTQRESVRSKEAFAVPTENVRQFKPLLRCLRRGTRRAQDRYSAASVESVESVKSLLDALVSGVGNRSSGLRTPCVCFLLTCK